MKVLKCAGAFLMVFAIFLNVQAQAGSRTLNENFRGKINDWDVEVWTQETHRRGSNWVPILDMGGVEMVINSDNTFSVSWDKTFNSLFRTGRKFPRDTRPADIGKISIDYNVPVFKSDDTSFMGIYGWTRSPLIEWYIVDNWHRNWRPGGSAPGTAREGYTHHGTLEIDGCTYDIITGWRVNQPSIDGNRTFLQIYSVRHTTRNSGTINVSAHFERWAKIGDITHTASNNKFNFGDASELSEVSFLFEGFGGLKLSTGEGTVEKLCISYGKNSLCAKNGCEICT